jgi:TfoX/Sxy family transcriptional regulator of competence genes
MSTLPATIAHILDTLDLPLTSRKMFGEYALYLGEKVVALVCDDTLFIKPTVGALAMVPNCELAPAYAGGKPMIVANELLDDPETCAQILRQVAIDLPPPKKPKGK